MDVYVDLDMVLVPLLDKWLEHINTDHGTVYTIEDIEKYNSKLLMHNWGYLVDGTIYDDLVPYKGAKDLLQVLGEITNVCILTSSVSKENDEKKKEFCTKYFGNVKFISTKIPKYKIVGNNILVDDCFDNIYKHIKNTTGFGILFNKDNMCNYNDFLLQDFRFHKANNYRGIYNIVENLLNTQKPLK